MAERPKICPNCNTDFSCYSEACWCNNMPRIIKFDNVKNCYCPKCLKEIVIAKIKEFTKDLSPHNFKEIKALGKAEIPVEGIDYYMNKDNLFVFTAWYHLRRGSCCGNNCKHCPYKSQIV